MLKLNSLYIAVIFLVANSAYSVPPTSLSGIKMGSNTGVVKLTTGTASANATTSDLSEGSNLYYTDIRAADANDPLLINGAVTATNANLVSKDGHEKSTQTTAPTAAPNAGAGTGGTCSLSNATDSGGKINIGTGSLLTPAAGAQCTLTFNKAYNVAPICTMSPANGTTGVSAAGYYFTTTTTTLVVSANSAPLNGLTLNWFYRCLETQ